MAQKEEIKQTAAEKLGNFLFANRTVVLTIVGIVAVLLIGYSVAIVAIDKTNEKGLAQIEDITFVLTNKSSDLSDADLANRGAVALEKLQPLAAKKGIICVRANMLAADLAFADKKYEDARKYYLAAVAAGKKSYTAPLCYFNAAVCSEELSDADAAVSYYESAIAYVDFFEANHAQFSIGRIKEAKKDYAGAAEAYQKLLDKNAADSWGSMARTRMIALKNEGSVQ